MKRSYLWTNMKARLSLIKSSKQGNYNWLFLPGGPGMGSEYLCDLTEMLDLPGNIWHLDLPGDGTNITENSVEDFSHWSEALVEAVSALSHVVLVGHSSGGMQALACPELEGKLTGLVLMSSAPNASWQEPFSEYMEKNPLPEAKRREEIYLKESSDETFTKYIIACTPYYSTPRSLHRVINLFETCIFRHLIVEWSDKNFSSTYVAKWTPRDIPVQIFSGEHDLLIPLKLFQEEKEFQRENVSIVEIKDAAHFPWLDNPEQTKKIFEDYYYRLHFASL